MFIEVEGIKTVEFGTGEIGVASGFIDDTETNYGTLSFSPQEQTEIGFQNQRHENGECYIETSETEAQLLFIFKRVESVDVIINKLNEVKKIMTE